MSTLILVELTAHNLSAVDVNNTEQIEEAAMTICKVRYVLSPKRVRPCCNVTKTCRDAFRSQFLKSFPLLLSEIVLLSNSAICSRRGYSNVLSEQVINDLIDGKLLIFRVSEVLNDQLLLFWSNCKISTRVYSLLPALLWDSFGAVILAVNIFLPFVVESIANAYNTASLLNAQATVASLSN